jgi:nucleoid-associated protein YgaU
MAPQTTESNSGIPQPEQLGVYLRNENQATPNSQKELDVLWSQDGNDRPTTIKEDNHPLLTFIAGLVTGIILTTLFFWVFNARPQPTTLPPVDEPVLEQPVATDEPVKVDKNGSVTPAKTDDTNNGDAPVPAGGLEEGTQATANLKGSMYHVKAGDTLGGITNKFYGSSSPKYIDRIVKANKLGNKHSLALDQELVIPPKNY